MASMWGNYLKLSIFGESHGAGIGVVIDGLPAGEAVDMEQVVRQMARRAPGSSITVTPRKESDAPQIISGITADSTNGAPLCAIIRNTDTHSSDYDELRYVPRPGHADYTGHVRYRGHNDPRGGGHFSGRLTAPMVFAGAVCRQLLARRGIEIGAHLASVGSVAAKRLDPAAVSAPQLRRLSTRTFPVLDPADETPFRQAIEAARMEGDSVGGVVECAAVGLPAGLGSPIFDGVENRLAGLLWGIPAVKGLEFGEGFAGAASRGSQQNDPYYMEGSTVRTRTNHHGGILGGITSGMPMIFRLAFKPTSSIHLPQPSIDLRTRQDTTLTVPGRHDPCVAVRAVPVVENLTAVCLMDLLLEAKGYDA